MASSLDELLALAHLYASEEEAGQLVGWIALRKGRSQALAGDRPEIERLEHVARHWLTEEERVRLAQWMLGQAARGLSVVPERALGRPSDRT